MGKAITSGRAQWNQCPAQAIRWPCAKYAWREEGANMQGVDYRQRLLDETDGLSDRDWEKIYRIVSVIRHEFLEEDDEARYHTASWIAAEREATEAHQQGGLRRFQSVQELAAHVERSVQPEGQE
jgi:hypothetical protein